MIYTLIGGFLSLVMLGFMVAAAGAASFYYTQVRQSLRRDLPEVSLNGSMRGDSRESSAEVRELDHAIATLVQAQERNQTLRMDSAIELLRTLKEIRSNQDSSEGAPDRSVAPHRLPSR